MMRGVDVETDSMLPLGIVFDLDGTLILSHHDFGRMREEIVRTAERYGAFLGPDAVTEKVGTSQILREARHALQAAKVPEGTISRFEEDVNRRIDAVEMEALPRTTARDGARGLLEALADRAFRLGLFTRSSKGFCQGALARTGLGGFFSHVRDRSTPGPAKPAPEALHLLLREMDVPVERALFVGDHLEDARCAVLAEVVFYGVLPDPAQPNPTTAAQFLASGATSVAADLDEIARLLDLPREARPRRATRWPHPDLGHRRND